VRIKLSKPSSNQQSVTVYNSIIIISWISIEKEQNIIIFQSSVRVPNLSKQLCTIAFADYFSDRKYLSVDMNATVDWADHVPEREGIKSTVNEVAFSPGMIYF
jgi:hypothetical protein